MDRRTDYYNQSMDDIVFEDRNREYGAYVHRRENRRNQLTGLSISIGVFILAVFMPAIIRLFRSGPPPLELVTASQSVVLQAPPSIQPFGQVKPPSIVEELKRPDQDFIEWQAAQKEDVRDTADKALDMANKDKKEGRETAAAKGDSSAQAEQGNSSNSLSGGKVWDRVEVMPEFVGGEDAYQLFMAMNGVYPEKENKEGIEGTAIVYFIVNEYGEVTDAAIDQSSGKANLDAEALRLVSMQPRYKPGKQHGLPVKVGIKIEVTFRQPN